MSLNASQLGIEGTVAELRRILVARFRLGKSGEAIGDQEPLFTTGVGLSSLEGVELLAEVERKFGIEFHNIENWFDDSPTLRGVAQHILDLSRQREK